MERKTLDRQCIKKNIEHIVEVLKKDIQFCSEDINKEEYALIKKSLQGRIKGIQIAIDLINKHLNI